MIKTKVAFSANQSNQKTFQIALIGWIKASPPKKPLLFWSCKQAHINIWFSVITLSSLTHSSWNPLAQQESLDCACFPHQKPTS